METKEKINAGNWSSYSLYMKELGKDPRKPTIFPKIYSRREKLLEVIFDGAKILDVGAFTKWVKNTILTQKPRCMYKSMDIDKSVEHDFYNLDEINEKFDFIILFDVVEHLPQEVLFSYLDKFRNILNEGGKIIISIPNIYYLGNVYFTTYNHVENYSFIDLHGFLREKKFSPIEIYRLTEPVFRLSWKLPFLLLRYLIRLLIINSFYYSDYAQDIMIIATKR